MRDLDRRLAAVASRQHSLLTLANVRDAGGTAADASRRVRSGRLERPYRGVFRIAGVPWTYEAEVLAAVFAAGPGAVASHFCAARLLGLGFRDARPELSIPRGRTHRPGGLRVHQSTDLALATTRYVDGVPVTDAGRTLLDLGRYLYVPSLTKAVDRAGRMDLVTWQSLLHTLLAHARQGRHGVTRLREVVSEGLKMGGFTDADSERMALVLIRDGGLPEPVLHHEVRSEDGELLAELDVAWPTRRAAVEIDGEVHRDPAVIEKDHARDHMLRRMGWTIRRAWWQIPVERPNQFLDIVRTLLADCPEVEPSRTPGS